MEYARTLEPTQVAMYGEYQSILADLLYRWLDPRMRDER